MDRFTVCGLTPIMSRILNWSWIRTRVWALQYALEEARITHSALGNLWRQAGVCMALAILRSAGLRYA